MNLFNLQDGIIDKPPHLDELLAAAEKIAADLECFYRLDFYIDPRGPVFGEFTSYPLAGWNFTELGDRLMCDLLDANPDIF